MSSKVQEINFTYKQATDFRTIVASGVVGTVTPSGLVYVGVYVERPHMPDSSVMKIEESGNVVGQEVLRVQNGLVREMQIGLMLDLNSATNLKTWLEGQIDILQKAQKRLVHVEPKNEASPGPKQ